MEETRDDGEQTMPEGERDTVPMLRAAPGAAIACAPPCARNASLEHDGRVTIFVRGYGVLAVLAAKR